MNIQHREAEQFKSSGQMVAPQLRGRTVRIPVVTCKGIGIGILGQSQVL